MDSRASTISNNLNIRKERPRELLLSGKAGVRTGYAAAPDMKPAAWGWGEGRAGVRRHFVISFDSPVHDAPSPLARCLRPSDSQAALTRPQTSSGFGSSWRLTKSLDSVNCLLGLLWCGVELIRPPGAHAECDKVWGCAITPVPPARTRRLTSILEGLALSAFCGASVHRGFLQVYDSETTLEHNHGHLFSPPRPGMSTPRLACYLKDKRGHS